MLFSKRIALAALALALPAGISQAAPFVDVLDLPAQHSELAASNPLLDLAEAGKRLVAVGQRGHILYSDDGGRTWSQASVPVSSDLTAVHFATPTLGWAVGHDGVVLHSSDGGRTWTKQLDGRQLGRLMLDAYANHPDAERWLEEAHRIESEGADKPFLDVWFEDERNGFIVGAFNLIFRTRDGGQSWEPWTDRTDNPSAFHLNAIGYDGRDLFVVGEQGLVLRLNPASERFEALTSPYQGSFFGVIGQPGSVLVYGLRGHVFRSTDGGANWVQVDTGLPVSITASARDASGHLYLLSQAGHTLRSLDGGASFQAVETGPLVPVSGAVAQAETGLVLAGNRGLSLRALAPAQQE
ncbi:WD40/YVTN/BNR-like repeat-containing protein [Pseudomonas boanensis]|uniref:WD40/YVTN/BNR-like repeat-containing protein n=1 Tax=Metapseudomonas boanensis TaxID=2822138 RepID=UPI0035D44713